MIAGLVLAGVAGVGYKLLDKVADNAIDKAVDKAKYLFGRKKKSSVLQDTQDVGFDDLERLDELQTNRTMWSKGRKVLVYSKGEHAFLHGYITEKEEEYQTFTVIYGKKKDQMTLKKELKWNSRDLRDHPSNTDFDENDANPFPSPEKGLSESSADMGATAEIGANHIGEATADFNPTLESNFSPSPPDLQDHSSCPPTLDATLETSPYAGIKRPAEGTGEFQRPAKRRRRYRTCILTRSNNLDKAPPSFEMAGENTSIIIGRQIDATRLTIPHPFMSRRHAELRSTEHGWEICDHGSLNGTHVTRDSGGEPQTTKLENKGEYFTLEEGDLITFGVVTADETQKAIYEVDTVR